MYSDVEFKVTIWKSPQYIRSNILDIFTFSNNPNTFRFDKLKLLIAIWNHFCSHTHDNLPIRLSSHEMR
jgi:hypothetical protein